VLEKLLHPPVIDGVEEITDVRVEHPVHHPADGHCQSVQGLVLRPAWPEAVRETQKLLLVDGLQDHPRRLLDDLVLQRGDAERTRATITFRDVHPPHRLRMVATAVNAVLEVAQAGVQILAVLAPRHTINARGRCLVEAVVRLSQ